MAPSLPNLRTIANLVSKRASSVTTTTTSNRGVAAVSQGLEASRKTVKPAEKEAAVAWTPDPVTGYYRPENAADEIDVAELRAMLLKQNKNKNN